MTGATSRSTMVVMPAPASASRLKRHSPIVFAGNIFAVIDDGRALAEEYVEAERLVLEAAARHPGGLGCLVIVPAGTRPPDEAHRKMVEGVLRRLSSHLAGLVWVVEGQGFQAAAVRGVLIGYGRRAYPTQVSTSIHEGLSWLLSRLKTSATIVDVVAVAKTIAETRAAYCAGV